MSRGCPINELQKAGQVVILSGVEGRRRYPQVSRHVSTPLNMTGELSRFTKSVLPIFWDSLSTSVLFSGLRVILILASIVSAVTASAQDYKYALDIKGVMASLSGGNSAKIPLQKGYGIGFTYLFHERWMLDLDLGVYKLYNDTTASSSFAFGGGAANATSAWRATRFGILANRSLFSPDNQVNVSLGLGGGLMIWKYVDSKSDTTLKAPGPHNEAVDFSASEIFVSAASCVEVLLSRRLSLKGGVHTDYLTTAGAEFGTGVNSSRARWLVGFSMALSFSFGSAGYRPQWKSEQSWTPATLPLAKPVADSHGYHGNKMPAYAADSDGDGVKDDRDDCPNTNPAGRGKVDIFGCPTDSDFDGIPDYLDACPYNQIGARVDETGCPLDSDADGVPDGLDDCPNTLYGAKVDHYGCIDLSILSKPLVLQIDYVPGSFEVDPLNREKLRDLARILNFVPDIKLEIHGYTDNIGKPRANKLLSEKRARRVRDYLVALGLAEDRIKVFGRGETNFVSANNTAEGRTKNRRVEIIFYR